MQPKHDSVVLGHEFAMLLGFLCRMQSFTAMANEFVPNIGGHPEFRFQRRAFGESATLR